MKIVNIDGTKGVVEVSGVRKEVNLMLIDNPKIDEYVLIHAGFAIEKLDEEEAKETMELIKEIAEKEVTGDE
jgi:hydrogenase expression/formation protein HypC